MVTERSAPGKSSTYLAVSSFIIGTLFLIVHLLFPNSELVFYGGYIYVLLAILVNSLMLAFLLWQLVFYRFYRETIVIRILILLANIPIALLYLQIIFNNFKLF